MGTWTKGFGLVNAIASTLLMLSGPVEAGLIIQASPDRDGVVFAEHVRAALAYIEQSQDSAIRRLYASVSDAPAKISIRAITDDSATWHDKNDRTRPHTEPVDGKRRKLGRAEPTGAVVFVTMDAVSRDSRLWTDGAFVHELVHAHDIAYGQYAREYPVRERRAVFVQNVWRARLGVPLRSSYHGRFATQDYQDARRRGALAELEEYIFTRADLPPPPVVQRGRHSRRL